MNNTSNENLRELLTGFMDEAAAKQTAEDIEKGEEILGANQSLGPDEQVLAEVKKNVAAALKRKRTVVFQRRILSAAAAAAVILVSVIALMQYSSNQNSEQTRVIANSTSSIPSRVWEGADDADVTVLRAEIENIQNELSGIHSDSVSTGGTNTTAGDLETELIETNGDIWKG
jgi:hypothetical protein